jgi:phosphatidylglycerol---prolipoprotein diacylglyceryl transferase
MLWWALAVVAAIALVYVLLSLRRKETSSALFSLAVAAGAGFAAYHWKTVSTEGMANIPIYSYGVMLGISLVVGWYLTLSLCERDGLPKETMANCYVITAVAAIAGSRLLYILTNLQEFNSFADVVALRKGGLVAYGGFLGGFLGSWGYLQSKGIRLLPWADDAVPSLASGLLITRIGCYLFGCDFGKPLPEGAPSWVKNLGTFPHWAPGTLADGNDGAPAFVRHLSDEKLHDIAQKTQHSAPVYPTQIMESLVGLGLLALLLWQRKHTKFRGQVFFLFVFAYGVLRFLLEIVRDDPERGEYGPVMGEHVLVTACLLFLAIGFVFGISLAIRNQRARTIARVIAFIPPVLSYVMLKPASFGKVHEVQLSTSQWIAVITALLASYFYARYWQEARKNPKLAMSLGEVGVAKAAVDEEEEEEEPAAAEGDEEDEGEAEAAKAEEKAPRKKKGLVKKAAKPEEVEKEKAAVKGDPTPEAS